MIWVFLLKQIVITYLYAMADAYANLKRIYGNKILWIINRIAGDDASHDSGKYNNHDQNYACIIHIQFVTATVICSYQLVAINGADIR